ncbi:MAG: hypothetical protein JNM27_03860 [Leptospirales bacterium]|nr:hypothetical protein [Leptospirales bacterium]
MNSILGEVHRNIEKARTILHDQADSLANLDLLVMPEMFFSGYVFKSRGEIEPFLEDPLDPASPTIEFVQESARKLGANVACGFPERAGQRAFNSQVVVSPEGKIEHVYRKHFLYETDEAWADEGSAFETYELTGVGKVGSGICMDLNPYRFQTPFEDFEFATAMRKARPGVLLLSMNWIAHETDNLKEELLAYWKLRLYPLRGQPCIAIIANRTGTERGIKFAGCSCVLDLKYSRVLASLGADEESLLICDV